MEEEKEKAIEETSIPNEIKDFVALLRDHELKLPKAVSIAKFIAATGSPQVFEQPEELADFLARWPREISPVQRRRVIQQWFAEHGIIVPEELLTKTAMHPTELGKEEKKEALSKRLEEGKVWTIRDNKPALAREGEMATSLEEVKGALKELSGDESIVAYDEKTGKHVPNFKAEFVRKNPMVAIQTARQYDTMLAAGETRDPLDIFFEQIAAFEQRRELLGISPRKEAGAVGEIISGIKELDSLRGSGQGDTLKEIREELARVTENMHQAELRHKDEQLTQMTTAIQGYRNEVSQLRSDVEQNRQVVGRSAYDLIGDMVKKVPDKDDVRQMVSEVVSKRPNLQPRSPAERARTLEKMAGNLEQAAEVRAVEDMWFKWE